MQPVDIRILTSFEEALPLWRLAEASADLHIYQTYDWLWGWYRSVGAPSGIDPCFVAVLDADERPLLLLPLAIERRGFWRRLVWMGAEFFDYHAPVLMPGASDRIKELGVDGLWRELRRKLPKVDYADFERQPEVVGEQPNPLIDETALLCTHSAHHTNLSGNWPSYYADKRGRRTRHNDRRKRKKLEKEGELKFVIAESRDDIDRLFPAMLRQKRAYTEAIGERNLLEQPGYEAFLRDRAEEGLEGGPVLLCGLDLDGEILAAQWGAVHRGRLYSIIASYDHGKHSKLSPGEFLLHDLMSWCFDNGVETFDFTYGDEPYKEPWCERQMSLYRGLMPITAWGAVRVYPLQWMLKLRRWAKSMPWISLAYAKTRKLLPGT